MKKLFISLSAIPLSLYRKSVAGLTMNNPNLYTEIFSKYGSGTTAKNKNRIYLPFGSKAVLDTKNPNVEVVDYLTKNNFSIDNYRLGTAIMPDGKRTIKIGKILSKEPKLKKIFDNDPSRSGATLTEENMLVVISRHPYDILGLSFDRGWTSCTNLNGGVNAHKLKASLKHGILVAYLIKTSDKNINNPTARILIRPYFNPNGEVILNADTEEYGDANLQFRKTILKFLSWANSGSPKGDYRAPEKMYLDLEPSRIWHGLTAKDITTPEQILYLTEEKDLLELTNKKYNKSLRVAVMQSIHATEEVLMLGMRDNDTGIRYAAVGNPNASREILMLGIKDVKSGVRNGTVDNPNITTEILRIGAKDENYHIREAVMINGNANLEILSMGLRDEHSTVKISAIRNKNATPELFLLALKDEDPEVRVAVARRKNLTSEVLMRCMKDKYYNVRLWAMKSSNASSELLKIGANDEKMEVRCAAMKNDNVSDATLKIGAKDKDWDVRLAAMENENASPEVLKICVEDEELDVRVAIVNNPNISLGMLKQLTNNSSRTVRAIAEKKLALLY